MQIWASNVVCKNPVTNGFSCGAVDKIIFKHAGDILTWDKIQGAINEFAKKTCKKCFSIKWRVTSLTPISYLGSDTAKRM